MHVLETLATIIAVVDIPVVAVGVSNNVGM